MFIGLISKNKSKMQNTKYLPNNPFDYKVAKLEI